MLPALRLWSTGLALSTCLHLAVAQPAGRDLDSLQASERVRAAAFKEVASNDNRWTWIESLAQLGWAFAEDERHEDAIVPYQAAIDALPPAADLEEPAFVALLHDGLGRALQNAGQFAEAERHLTRAVRLRTRAGKDAATQLGISEGHLGLLHLTRGRYAEAERLFRSALDHTPPERHDLLAHRHDCLGRYFLALRLHERATEAYQTAVRHASVDAKPSDPLLLDLRTNLALCRFRSGKTDDALSDLDVLLELNSGDDADLLRRAELQNLYGTILAANGQPGPAEGHLEDALKIVTAQKGKDHPALAPYLANLGSVRRQGTDPAHAIPPLVAAKTILLANVDKHHQALVEVLYQIAACNLALGEPAPVRASVIEARQSAGALLDTFLASGSERELLTFRHQVDLHSLVCQLGDPLLIADSLLNGKGNVMDAVLERRTAFAIRTRRASELQDEIDRLRLQDDPAQAERLAKLEHALEALAAPPGEAPAPRKPLRWQELRDALPPHAAFVDCVHYSPGDKAEGRYGALLFLPQGAPLWIPLGTDRSMGRLTILRRSLETRAQIIRNEGRGEAGIAIAPLLADLYRNFWQPIAEALPEGTREVILSPEGQLHLLPYSALRTPDNRFLCEELPVLRLVDSARTLLRPPAPPVKPNQPWLALGLTEFAAFRADTRSHSFSPEWTDAVSKLSDLPTVRTELDALRKLAPPRSNILLDGEAREATLASHPTPPAALHLATHGLHVPLGGSHDLSSDPSLLYENGMILAPGDGHDGILFPEEAAALDLRGTRLVTLSTCRSAFGRPVFGEGLLGLRRGFAKAGAANILASLWEIPDDSTAAFMTSFYTQQLESQSSPAAVLWSLQAEQLAKSNGKSPAKLETAILSFGGFVLTSREPL